MGVGGPGIGVAVGVGVVVGVGVAVGVGVGVGVGVSVGGAMQVMVVVSATTVKFAFPSPLVSTSCASLFTKISLPPSPLYRAPSGSLGCTPSEILCVPSVLHE